MRAATPVPRAVAALVALLFIAGCSTPDQAAEKVAPRISDATFEAAARTACQQAVHVFDTDTSLPKDPSKTVSADFLENVDATFRELVARLRTLPVAPGDQVAVAGWLTDWDAYVAYGHTYAEAVRVGNDGALVKRDATSQGALRRRLRAFAAVNNMRPCRFP
ncbi:MAG TPA: hypothetical protein VNY84_05985 [Acidimicrobiales bacterium]|jgi:hypothetical protein|nr:hypothetical protein [Acidimicrobiales bacterium]